MTKAKLYLWQKQLEAKKKGKNYDHTTWDVDAWLRFADQLSRLNCKRQRDEDVKGVARLFAQIIKILQYEPSRPKRQSVKP